MDEAVCQIDHKYNTTCTCDIMLHFTMAAGTGGGGAFFIELSLTYKQNYQQQKVKLPNNCVIGENCAIM